MTAVGQQEPESGFLTIPQIITRQRTRQIFEIPDMNNQQTIQFLEDKAKKDLIVIDLRIGDEYYISSRKTTGLINDFEKQLVIEAGEFALLTTHAKFHMPEDLMAFISIRFSQKLQGLVNISGFHVDPGYSGKIIFSVYNAGPNRITIDYKDEIFMIMFSKIGNNIIPPPNKKHRNIERITAKYISGLSGVPVSPRSLETRIATLEMRLKMFWGLAIGGVITLVGLFIERIFSSGG